MSLDRGSLTPALYRFALLEWRTYRVRQLLTESLILAGIGAAAGAAR